VVGIGEGISVGYREFFIVNVMEEHVDAAEVVGSDVDLLAKEAIYYLVLTKNFCVLKKERS
jgi:hypothetical protein